MLKLSHTMTGFGMTSLAMFALILVGEISPARAYTGEELSKEARISLSDARATAIHARSGTITDEELEKEDGTLRYSFDIKVNKITYEVGVDAITGKILENAPEGKNPD